MSLPVPNLDDRRFQDLVDDAKRMVQSRCPEWTDHNVSDPGVTLIETFAMMVDQLVYRLNRVPDKLYVKFLELIGVRRFPPSAATVDLTFWLSAPQESTIRVPAGTRVSTKRVDRHEDAIVFTTLSELEIVPCSMTRLVTIDTDHRIADHTEDISMEGMHCFGASPRPGDRFLVGLDRPVPSCAVVLRMSCVVEGVGVDPEDPPVVWEAFDGHHWLRCEVERDTTGGLNRSGDVVLHIPREHSPAVIAGHSAGWLRCRVVEPLEGQPFYSAAPRVSKVEARTMGGTTGSMNADLVSGEVIGVSEGTPGQRFRLQSRPVIASGGSFLVEVSSEEEGWVIWEERLSFGRAGPDERVFVLDANDGEVIFGPAVRLPDGTLKSYGAIPPKGATVRVPQYRVGGGRSGNVAAGALSVMRTPIPFVGRVENRRPAAGGIDGEDMEAAKERGPVTLHSLGRAVTREDYELIARQSAPEAARVHCTVDEGQGGVRVLVVPAVGSDQLGRVEFADLVPHADMLRAIAHELDKRRTVGARVVVEPPTYRGVTVVARVRAHEHADSERLRPVALRALYQYLHPLLGGRDGHGWPFGRPVQAGGIYSVLQHLPGVEQVEEVRLFPADPITGERGDRVERVDVGPDSLVFSYGHEVMVDL